MLAKIYLIAISASFLLFGAWSIVDPIGMTARMGVEVSGLSGAFEMRGVYGGVSLGAGLLCLAGAMRTAVEKPALFFLVAYMGGYVIGRTASLVAGDSASVYSWGFAGFEAVAGLIAALLLFRKA